MSVYFFIDVYYIFLEAQRMSPQDAFHETIHGAPGGCEALAVRLNMSAAVLRNKANPSCAGNKVTLEDADRVMGLTGNCAVLDALAANHGRVCVQVEQGGTASDLAVLEIMTKCWATNGDFGAEVNRALEDGRIDRREIASIKAAVLRANQAMQQLVTRLEGMAEK